MRASCKRSYPARDGLAGVRDAPGHAGRRVLPGLSVCAALAAAALVAPQPGRPAASVCGWIGNASSFHGTVHMGFDGTVTAPDPGTGGTETVSLERGSASLKVALTSKASSPLGIIFSGKLSGGHISVKDTFKATDSGGTSKASESYSGPVTNKLPGFGTATLMIDGRTCRYVFQAGFGVKTTFSGDKALNPGSGATGSAISTVKPVPGALSISGVQGIDASDHCPGDPLTHPAGCYEFGGTWTTDFGTLKSCHSVTAESCDSGDKPLGTATLSWHLSPLFPKPTQLKK